MSAGRRSFLAPVRCYAGDAVANGRVCTLEAVAALLSSLEGGGVGPAAAAAMFEAVRLKVDAVQVTLGAAPVYEATSREGLLGAGVGRRARKERRRRLQQAAAAAAAAAEAQAAAAGVAVAAADCEDGLATAAAGGMEGGAGETEAGETDVSK